MSEIRKSGRDKKTKIFADEVDDRYAGEACASANLLTLDMFHFGLYKKSGSLGSFLLRLD